MKTNTNMCLYINIPRTFIYVFGDGVKQGAVLILNWLKRYITTLDTAS